MITQAKRSSLKWIEAESGAIGGGVQVSSRAQVQIVHTGLPGQLNGTCNPYEINGTKCGSGWVVGTPRFNCNLVPSTRGLRSMHTTFAEVRGHPSGLFFRHVAGQGLAQHILSCCSQVCQARNDRLE